MPKQRLCSWKETADFMLSLQEYATLRRIILIISGRWKIILLQKLKFWTIRLKMIMQYSPVLVLCDCKTLDTLPDEILSDGTAEALKYGVLFDGELFGKIASGKVAGDRESIIARCVDLKRMVVETDEFDRGARQLLNFGHTIGHAIEKCSGFTISHGRGVAVGMAMIAKAAAQKGISEYDCAPRIISALNNCRLPHKTDYTAKQLFEAALLDKKRQSGSITLVLPRRIGECFLKKIPVEELIEYIEAGI